jgi:chromosome segregation ATPase
MNLNKLEIKRQSLELQFSNIYKQIEELENKRFFYEELSQMNYNSSIKYINRINRIDDKIYKLEDKQGTIQDKIDSIMDKLNITY